ncbi:hypothetical protein FOL47_008183 [Perkinsus chesapeaki]|uniref:IF140/IFT172/WDR19 TPR domain-containing protein n=1 Tax=Perkinsus chesapeaki TaxID=330153 RepID=A0A7J6MUS4_PERCH|nr:hypothetical protein FOL47_008183 [Perkinsus chesapeaki]
MQVEHSGTLIPGKSSLGKLTTMSWSPRADKLGTVGMDGKVHLLNELGELKDAFPTKPQDKENPRYMVTSMSFSPDGTRIAIGQSDSIVYVYKIGASWGDKKSICNKWPQTSPVTCLSWPSSQSMQLVLGLSDGRLRVANCRTQKCANLYSGHSPVVSLCQSMDGYSIVAAHSDGSLFRFTFESEVTGAPQILQLVKPYSLCCVTSVAWGLCAIAMVGTDHLVRFFDCDTGHDIRTFDYSTHPSLGKGKRNCDPNTREWFEVVSTWSKLDRLTYVSLFVGICRRSDGAKLYVGNVVGELDQFDVCWKRILFRGEWEFLYTSPSQVTVKRVGVSNTPSPTAIVFKSSTGNEITKINIYHDQFIVAFTSDTLLLGNMDSNRLSEVPWTHHTDTKFFFDNPDAVMAFKLGELLLIGPQYGEDEVMGCARTEYVSPHLISYRSVSGDPLSPHQHARGDSTSESGVSGKDHRDKVMVMAFLLDANTIRVNEVRQAKPIATIEHDCKVDWLSLNPGTAHRLLFRDKRRRLYLYDLQTQQRTALLSSCNYVNWVPDSDVVVAQSRDELCVWYSIATPDRITKHAIKGDIEDIIRAAGRTVVLVDESPSNQVEYELDEALINFSASLERGHFAMAVDVLEYLPLGPETTGMWRQLGSVSLDSMCLAVAERCYAVLGEVEVSRELRKIQRLAQKYAGETGDESGLHHPEVVARLAVLKKQFSIAEEIYTETGHLEDAIRMYQEIHKYDDAIRLAERHGYPDVMRLKTEFLQWLLQTHQEDLAGSLQEREGNYEKAIALYLKSGMAVRASSVVAKHPMNYSQELLQKIAASLKTVGCEDKAGELYEKMGMLQPAMDSYRRGHAYYQAIELAKKHRQFAAVPMLHEEWGDYLVSERQYEQAIDHFTQANKSMKAINAALQGRQWSRAEHLLTDLEASGAEQTAEFDIRQIHEKLGDHYSSSRQHQVAEKWFVRAGAIHKCVQMYITAQEYDQASRVAKTHMSQKDRVELYTSMADKLECEGKLSEAEELYIVANEYDLAIEMYKNKEDYHNMIRLVRKYRPGALNDVYREVAEKFEAKGNFLKAEQYFCDASGTLWQSAVSMYRGRGRWEDAKRVAKARGGKDAFEKVVIDHAHATSRDLLSAARVIASSGLVDAAIDHAISLEDYSVASVIAEEFGAEQRMTDIHLKKAMHLEDTGHFAEAEAEFMRAGKPKEAIDMYTHQKDWAAALRVAENSGDRDSMRSILEASAKELVEQGRFGEAEKALIEAGKPRIIVYLSNGMHQEAVRVCRTHCPTILPEVMKYAGHAGDATDSQRGYNTQTRPPAKLSVDDLMAHAKLLEEAGDHSKAIDLYLDASGSDMSPDKVESILLDGAVRVATHYSPQRYTEVAQRAAVRLEELRRYDMAAELYESIDKIRDAVECLVKLGQWDRAIQLAKQRMPSLAASIEERHRDALVKSGKTDQLAGRGDVVHALDAYARSNEWAKCLNLAESSAPKHLEHYVLQYVKVLISESKCVDACKALLRYGPYKDKEALNIYSVMASKIATTYPPAVSEDAYERDLLQLRDLLLKVLGSQEAGTSPPSVIIATASSDHEVLIQYLMACHLMWIGFVSKKYRVIEKVICKAAVSLCRYCSVVPVDRVFYNAGVECKRCGDISMAFFFLNRYLDLVDAIRDPDSAAIDNSDFLETDIPSPYDINLPRSLYGDDHLVEEARDWVLGWSVDNRVQQEMSTRQCDKCESDIYAAALVCPKCQYRYTPCVVTGYPVVGSSKVECTHCRAIANKDDWNEFVRETRACPWCMGQQGPVI